MLSSQRPFAPSPEAHHALSHGRQAIGPRRAVAFAAMLLCAFAVGGCGGESASAPDVMDSVDTTSSSDDAHEQNGGDSAEGDLGDVASDSAELPGGDDTSLADTAQEDTPSDTVATDTSEPRDVVDGTDAVEQPGSRGIWISHEEIMALPTSGAAWDNVLAAADADAGVPNLSDQDQDNNVHIMAKALVYVRTGDESYRTAVRQAVMAAIETENGGRTLALGRELAAYVIAADLVVLEPSEDATFRAWLDAVRHEDLDGRTLISTHEDRPNNWGTHAGASRIAAAVYLGDTADLAAAADVFKGWVGDRATYAQFSYGELSWQAAESAPVGINPMGTTKLGESVDGVIPDDMRRGCSIQFPPCPTEYPWEGLQGAIAQAHLLNRQGYGAWQWEDQALLRAVQFLWDLSQRYPNDNWWADGDDEWQLWLVNHAYGTTFPAALPARAGKNVGWTDWTHAG